VRRFTEGGPPGTPIRIALIDAVNEDWCVPRSCSPAFITPMTAKVVETLPEGEHWIYEVKFDGYRALLLKNGRHVQLRSRNDNDPTATYPTHRFALAARIDNVYPAPDSCGVSV
jgi:ATP-dependent DNA ligase